MNLEAQKVKLTMKLSLGRAIALIRHSNVNESVLQDLHDDEKSYVQKLSKRQRLFHDEPGLGEEALSAIPEHCCSGEQCILFDNEDYFIVYLLAYPPKSVKQDYCGLLTRHLNNCYRCFKIYSGVMRDYYYQSKNIS